MCLPLIEEPLIGHGQAVTSRFDLVEQTFHSRQHTLAPRGFGTVPMFMERVAPVVDATISALARKKFDVDPIAGAHYSRATSGISTAYKRHGKPSKPLSGRIAREQSSSSLEGASRANQSEPATRPDTIRRILADYLKRRGYIHLHTSLARAARATSLKANTRSR